MVEYVLNALKYPVGRYWDRIVRRVRFGGYADCWEWVGSRTGQGYGKLQVRGDGTWTAHRLMYIIMWGPVPSDILVCHKCDNPPCVNPHHLFLGTHQDNTDDMKRKGRHRSDPRTGELNYRAKLTEAQVRLMRSTHGVTQGRLAEMFGVSRTQVSRILNGTRWGHLT